MLVMPAWAAALLITALLLAGAGWCAWIGSKRMAAVEGPATAARRRFQGHSEWWQDRVAGSASTSPYAAAAADDGDEDFADSYDEEGRP
jgi:hypothetical protein